MSASSLIRVGRLKLRLFHRELLCLGRGSLNATQNCLHAHSPPRRNRLGLQESKTMPNEVRATIRKMPVERTFR
jgi:hypothetical protein